MAGARRARRSWLPWRRRPEAAPRFATVGGPPAGVHPGWSAGWTTAAAASVPAPAPAAPLDSSLVSPRVVLGFADGSECEIDPWSREGRALMAVAGSLVAPARHAGSVTRTG